MDSTIQSKPRPNLNIKQRLLCGVGHVLNELSRQLSISFTIVFLMQVVGLPASDAGLALLIAQLSDAFVSPINGYLCDRIRIPFISKKMGCRKSWHLVGTILLAVSVPLFFSTCLPCSQYKGVSWLPLVYYGCVMVSANVGYNMVEINHLAIISTATMTIEEGTAVNALRTAFSFLSGVYVYLVAWGLLGQDSVDELGPESLPQFANARDSPKASQSVYPTFDVTMEERQSERKEESENSGARSLKGEQDCSVWENTDADDNEGDAAASKNAFEDSPNDSHQLGIFNPGYHNENTGTDTRKAENDESIKRCFEVDVHFDVQTQSSTETGKVENNAGDPPKASQSVYPTVDVTMEERHSEREGGSEDSGARSLKGEQDCSVWENTDADDNERDAAASKNAREDSPKDSHQLGIFNPGYHNENTGTDTRKAENDKSFKRCCEVDVHFEVKIPWSTQTGKIENVSFFEQKQRELETAVEEKGVIHEVGSPETNAFEIQEETLSEEEKKPSFAEKEGVSENTGTEKDSIDITCKAEKRRPSTIREWLKNPRLYKVAVIFTCTRLVLDSVYVYLPLYLTLRLGLGKQSIAYFPLLLLLSATLGSPVSNKVNKKIGSKWTYILASVLVIGASVYCYFQTPSMKQSTYAPVILIGIGMSIMYVMGLAFATELIGDDKETSGSVFAVMVFIARIFSGVLFMAIQEFYPENDTDLTASSDYVRHVFSLVPGILAFTGSLMVLFSQSSSLCSTRKEYSPNKEATVQSDASTSFDVVIISEKKANFVSPE